MYRKLNEGFFGGSRGGDGRWDKARLEIMYVSIEGRVMERVF